MFIILCLKLCKNTIALHRKNYENGFKKFYISNIFKKRSCLKNKKYKYAHIVLAIATLLSHQKLSNEKMVCLKSTILYYLNKIKEYPLLFSSLAFALL